MGSGVLDLVDDLRDPRARIAGLHVSPHLVRRGDDGGNVTEVEREERAGVAPEVHVLRIYAERPRRLLVRDDGQVGAEG